MRFLFFKPTSTYLLLCVFLNLHWAAADGASTSTPNETTATPSSSWEQSPFTETAVTATTEPPTTPPPPPANVGSVERGQDETSITLKWMIVNSTLTYKLTYNNIVEEINGTSEDTQVQYVVSNLTAGLKYNFTLFTILNGVNSSGYSFSAVTAPLNPEEFEQEEQDENSVTLQWTQVTGINNYILNVSGVETNVSLSDNENVTYTIIGLQTANVYDVTLFTALDYARSSGKQLLAVTAPRNPAQFKVIGQNESSITLEWNKEDEVHSYILDYGENITNITASKDVETYTVPALQSASKYSFTLFAVFENVQSSGETITAVTAPRNPAQFKVIGQNESSITLEWNKEDEVHSYILEYEENKTNITASKDLETYTVPALQSASKYNFTLFAVFENVQSSGETITAVTAPENPEEFHPINQSETSITLQWKRVKDIKDYKIHFDQNETTVNGAQENISHTIKNLKSGAAYNISLFALFEHVNSSGISITAFTVPPQVSSVSFTERNVTSATLKWENPNKSWTYKVEINSTSQLVNPDDSDFVSYILSDLKPGTLYSFNVITLFSGLNSPPYEENLLTQIECEKITWNVTTSSIQGSVTGLFSKAIASNTTQFRLSSGGGNVFFDNLYPGATYEISLLYERPSENLTQCASNPSVTIDPLELRGYCKNQASGYSALIVWDKPEGVCTKVRIDMNGQSHSVDGNETQFIRDGLQPAKTYSVSLVSFSGGRRTKAPDFPCATDNRGVIAGSVVGVLLFAVLVCMALFVLFRRPDIIRGKKSFIAGFEKPATKRKVIPKANFPDHFTQLSADENRGFSEEYEALAPVGTEQTRKAATLPENKSKNRFTNILPYDWSRVKLITSSPNEILDYINANYMPGYNRNREYIASQGPLPNTVKDFWRMIWEQRVKAIVMVTNCIESGRTKCECYWPEDQKPCLHGELLVTLTSEQKEPNWTLREFRVKDRNDSEERTVKHFHFTAWPDHGVPQGTQILIQFRGLVRWFIESDGNKSPTVVHCSAGVGRTGTIIALDVLLQQLEKQRAVGINDFVHRMRQHRSHMVQTESQYVFLHQCIMDSLKQNEKQEENIYENSDLIYANATALREFHNHNT